MISELTLFHVMMLNRVNGKAQQTEPHTTLTTLGNT